MTERGARMFGSEHTRRTVLRSIGAGTAVAVGGVGVVTADDDTDDQGDGTDAEVRVGHLSPDTPDVDVYVGGDPDDGDTPTIENLSYGNFAPNATGSYKTVPKGTYDISVAASADSSIEPIDIDGFELEANRDYTILAIGEIAPENDEPDIRALPLVDNADDEDALPPADATLVRFVHASPDAGEVDIEVDDEVLLSDVSFGTASGYYEAPEDVEVSVAKNADDDEGEETDVLGPITNPFEDGEKGTVYVIGNNTPEDDPDGDGPVQADNGLAVTTTLDATNPSDDRGDDGDDDEGENDGEGDDDEGEGEEDNDDEGEGEEDNDDEGEDDSGNPGRGRGRGE